MIPTYCRKPGKDNTPAVKLWREKYWAPDFIQKWPPFCLAMRSAFDTLNCNHNIMINIELMIIKYSGWEGNRDLIFH